VRGEGREEKRRGEEAEEKDYLHIAGRIKQA
jgi:hypothetical protein